MIRFPLSLIVLMALATHAIGAAPLPPPPTPPAPAPTAITAAQAKSALDVLNDPQKRAAFEATLQAIVRTQAGNAAGDGTLEPDSLGAHIVLRAYAAMGHLRTRIAEAADSVESVPLLWAWLDVMVTNPTGQALLTNLGWRLFLAMAAAAAAGWLTQRSLRPRIARLDALARALVPEAAEPEDRAEGDVLEPVEGPAPAKPRVLKRIRVTAARFGLALLPVVALWTGGHLVALAVGGWRDSSLTIEAVLEAVATTLTAVKLFRLILSPEDTALSMVRLSARDARYLQRWLNRLTGIGIAGYATAEAGSLLGLSRPGHDAVMGSTFIVLTCGLVIMIVAQRRTVRRVLRGRDVATGSRARFRKGLANSWHWIAIAVLVLLWVGWAIDISMLGGELIWAAGLVAAVLIAAKLAQMGLLQLIEQLLPAAGMEASDSFPGLEDRVRFYHPAIIGTVRVVVNGLAVLALLQVFGAGTLSWLWATQGGQRVLSGLATMAATVMIAIVVWEMVNAAIKRHLARLQQEAQLARSARLRTLLPMLRTILFIVIGVVTVLMVLSEIGINIAPLLAGAGILGVAIGFGSQKLVQDLITGIFLLLENAIQVGDWVNAAGLAGKVEGLSVRTIRLRAADGALHIVPFSSVGSVTNYTKGVGNADVRATLDLQTDTDRASDIMAAIVAEMQTEPEYQSKIIQDFTLWGVDKIDAGGVTVVGQVACTDSGRWSVQREINRRMKQRFDEVGIKFFAPRYATSPTG